MANEGLGTSVFSVMVIQLGLRLKAFSAYITNEFAITRMQLGMSFQKCHLLKTLIAAFEIAHKSLVSLALASLTQTQSVALRSGFDDRHLLPTTCPDNITTRSTGGNDCSASFTGVD